MIRFEDIVNKEFFEEYGDKIRPEYGVIGKDGKVSYTALRDVFRAFHGEMYPNQFIYALIHGSSSLIDSWNLPSQFRGKEEEIYKLCLDRDTTWEDELGYKKTKDGVLL